MDIELKLFNSKNPQLEDYERKFNEFQSIIDDIETIEPFHQIGALALNTSKVKDSLKEWVNKWRFRFSKDLHKKARDLLESLMDEIKQI